MPLPAYACRCANNGYTGCCRGKMMVTSIIFLKDTYLVAYSQFCCSLVSWGLTNRTRKETLPKKSAKAKSKALDHERVMAIIEFTMPRATLPQSNISIPKAPAKNSQASFPPSAGGIKQCWTSGKPAPSSTSSSGKSAWDS